MHQNRQKQTTRFTLSKLTVIIALMAGTLPPCAWAAETPVMTQRYNFTIPAGALGDALILMGNQSKIQIITEASLTQGRSNQAINGQYTVSAALEKLLQGSGLAYRTYGQSVVLYKLPENANNEMTLGAVRVQGSADGYSDDAGGDNSAYGGINGSRDVTATEGSNSYATNKVNIGGKTPTRLNEVTNAVSVLTEQRIEDQGIQSVDNALERSTGITRLISGSGGTPLYYSRGFAIENVQIDGGAATNDYERQLTNTDLSMYDSVQILRGADAFGNAGSSSSPSGTINLVRKKPLDHNQLSFDISGGSWDSYRGSIDVTGPITSDGTVRGRAVVTGENTNKFYDNSESENALVFGTLEADLTPDTMLTVGGSYQKQKLPIWPNGLPRFITGEDLRLPRESSLITPDGALNYDTYELFAKLSHEFNKKWSWNSSISYKENTVDGQYGILYLSYIMPDGNVDGGGYLSTIKNNENKNKLLTWDTALNGQFEILGLPQKVEFGFNSSNQKYKSSQEQVGYSFDANIYTWQPSQAIASEIDPSNARYVAIDNDREYTYLNAYGSFDFNILPKLHFLTGLRWSYTDYNNSQLIAQPYYDYVGNTERKYKDTRWQVPSYALRYDLSRSWSAYAGYKNIYQPQAENLTASGEPLSPKEGNSKEIGIKYTSPSNDLNTSLIFYQSKVDNIAALDYAGRLLSPNDPNCCYLGGGSHQDSKGIDLELQGKILPWWEVSLGYTFNINKQAGSNLNSAGQDVAVNEVALESQSPKHLFKLWNIFQLSGNEYIDRLKLGLGVTAQSSTYFAGYGYDPETFDSYSYNFNGPGYAVVDVLASYKINKNLSLSLNVNNLFDKSIL